MKSNIIWSLLFLLALSGYVAYSYLHVEEVSYVQPVEEVEEEVIIEEPKDVIKKAQEELDRINKELDAEERSLLAQKAAIDARLESILETRMSFQSAPGQSE